MHLRFKSIIILCFISCNVFFAQQKTTEIIGKVLDIDQKPLLGVTVYLEGTQKGSTTNSNGEYKINNIPKKSYTIIVSYVGFKTITKKINVNKTQLTQNFILKEENNVIDEVVVKSKTKTERIKTQGFSVESVDLAKIKTQSIELNKILNNTPGINVRTTGGIGSDFEYSINGLSGNAIRFFIDGIPNDFYGESYSINNIPIGLVDRIDIFKGVVPVELGSDALGGAINLVTNQNVSNFLEASTTFGSFNTFQTVVNGLWRSKSGFTTKLSLFSTVSDNNYKVWGDGVFYGEEGTGRAIYFTKENPAERFNDDFKTATGKLDLGFTNKKWADQFFVSLLASDQKKGLQTGRTMGHVYGERRNNEKAIISSIKYKKKNFITKGLDVDAFAGYSHITNAIIDTTKNTYDWKGDIIGYNPSGGEVGRNGASLYTQKDKSQMYRFNGNYKLPSDFNLVLNYIYQDTKRTGEDPFASENSIPYSEPQSIGSHTTGLSLKTKKFNNRLRANIFLKYFAFDASINEVIYTTEQEIITNDISISNWGGGLATSYKFSPNFLIKASLEQATRLPSPTEALGDGINIEPNFDIKPEESLNINLGTILGRYPFGKHGLKIIANTSYRSVSNKIDITSTGLETENYFNIDKIEGFGAEIDFLYDYDDKLKFNLNATYVGLKNTQKIDENGNENILFGVRLKNQPYFMTNAGINYTINNFIQKEAKLLTYINSSYVHEFFLRWPSLGFAELKNTVPSQLVFDTGASYTFPSEKLSVAFDVSNILNEQVYDNFLLQKPGRAFFLKVTYNFLNK